MDIMPRKFFFFYNISTVHFGRVEIIGEAGRGTKGRRMLQLSKHSIVPLHSYLKHLSFDTALFSISATSYPHRPFHTYRALSSTQSTFFHPSHPRLNAHQPKSSPTILTDRDHTHPNPPEGITNPALLRKNEEWAAKTANTHTNHFQATGSSQAPKILWIGCSDSRVPETSITGLLPGDMFVHRNIANIVHAGDLSCASVIEYGVEHLGVEMVVVCGHDGCGGVGGALGNAKIGGIDTWLLPLRSIRAKFYKELEGMEPAARVTKIVEENVKAGVRTLRENASVIKMQKVRKISVHGLVYDVKCGKLREVEVPESEEEAKIRQACFDTSV